jgi:acetoacetyl-CoA synthetase
MREIPEAMRADIPVFGLRAGGLDSTLPSEGGIEAMASTYARVIRDAQPDGPYRLTGHSFGALVAFEIARQLSDEGAEIGWLGMIDAELSTRCHSPARRWGHRIALPAHYTRAALRDPQAAGAAARRAIPRVLPGHALQMSREAPGDPDPLEWLEDAPVAIQRRAAVYLEAADAYRPRPYTGPMTYFLPTVRRFHVFADPMPVWRNVARGGIDVERVPGPHVGMVSGAGARAIACRIDEDLG